MHTHWSRTLPSRWFLCTWLLASSCAILCSSARHLDLLFCINLCGCVFGLQARRALRASLRKQGWIRKSRSAGGRRCKGHRRQKARRRLRAALQVCGWLWLLVCGCHGSSVTPVGYQAACMGHARRDSTRGRRRREPRAAKGKVVRQSEIGAYFLLAPGQGGCLFYTVGTEVSGGQKWELSCALGCRRAERLDVVCYVDLCGYGFRLQTRRDVRKGCPQAQTAPSWYLPRKVRNREQHAVNGNPEAAETLQARIRSNVIHMPGNGWCFFYAVSRYFKGSTHSGHGTAADIYLQAIEWLLAAQHGPRADAVATACVPFDDDELQLHEHFLRQQPTAVETAPSNTTEVVLLSKLHAVLLQPDMLDSIHHASAGVELWALTQHSSILSVSFGVPKRM